MKPICLASYVYTCFFFIRVIYLHHNGCVICFFSSLDKHFQKSFAQCKAFLFYCFSRFLFFSFVRKSALAQDHATMMGYKKKKRYRGFFVCIIKIELREPKVDLGRYLYIAERGKSQKSQIKSPPY